MGHLSRADMEAALDFAAFANALASTDEDADALLLGRIVEMIGCDAAGYDHFDKLAGVVLSEVEYPVSPIAGPGDPRLHHLLMTQNPFCDYRSGTGAWSAVRLTDVVDMRHHRRTELFSLVQEDDRKVLGLPLAFEVQMRLPGGGRTHRTIAFARSRRDFSRRDVMLLNIVRPLLMGFEARRARERAMLPPGPSTDAFHVTRREGEILDLVAAGATNAQIAQGLWISPDTVRKHLENVYLKLGVSSRTAALARTGRTLAASERHWTGPASRNAAIR